MAVWIELGVVSVTESSEALRGLGLAKRSFRRHERLTHPGKSTQEFELCIVEGGPVSGSQRSQAHLHLHHTTPVIEPNGGGKAASGNAGSDVSLEREEPL